MSNYGPPGGPYPGQSPEPWQRRQPDDPYGQPADPWGGPDAGATPGAGGSPAGYGDYPDAGGHSGYGASPQHPPTQRYESDYPQSGHGYPPTSGGPAYQAGSQPVYHPSPEPTYHGGPETVYQPAPDPGYRPGPDPVWTPGPQAPVKKSNTGLIALLVALAVLVCGGGGTALYLLGQQDDKTPKAGPTTGAPVDPTGKPSPDESAEPSDQPSEDTPTPVSSTDVSLVKAGQCVTNDGTADRPKLVISKCTGKSYQVLRRFDGTTDGENDAKSKCAKVNGYTDWYFYNSELDSLDFVLCLKKR